MLIKIHSLLQENTFKVILQSKRLFIPIDDNVMMVKKIFIKGIII